ncbi:MAG: molybdenum cofactor guanylyltransferase [Alphaproteobacteria bacterium]|nr:molybdenum cofactor guanylyltransferase [Alphaproteobacteria bacterium]
MRVLGAIIAGGQSRRMGGQEKALLDFGGEPLLQRIISVLRPQVDGLIINANGEAARFEGFGVEVVADSPGAEATPLAGLAAVLAHAQAQGFGAVVTVPSDTPLLPPDLVARLGGGGARIARSGGQDHFLTGYWPVQLATALDDAMARQAMVRMKDWVKQCGAQSVTWANLPHDPFFNINTPEDLAAARAIAGKAE